MSDLLGLPIRSYQRLEKEGRLPQEATLRHISSRLGISEVKLFQDPEQKSEPEGIPRDLLRELASASADELSDITRMLRESKTDPSKEK